MLDRQACQRRVYRLAALLNGDPQTAADVITDVLAARSDLRTMDGAHMDRLTILRCRERGGGTTAARTGLPEAVGRGLAALTEQQREAWVLVRVYHTPLRDAARAMDCSVSATQRHLQLADAVVGPGDAESALRYSLTLEVPEFFRRAERRRRQFRRMAMALVILIGVAATMAAVLWWSRVMAAA